MRPALQTVAAMLLTAAVLGPYAFAFTPSRDGEVTQTYVATADTSNSSGTNAVLAAGLQCAGLQPSTTYLVEVVGQQNAGAATAGIQWRIGDGTTDNDGSGSVQLYCRTSATGVTEAVFTGSETPGSVTYCLGTASSTTYNGFSGDAIWTTDATPSAIGVYFRSEVDTSSVTVKAGSMIRCRVLR